MQNPSNGIRKTSLVTLFLFTIPSGVENPTLIIARVNGESQNTRILAFSSNTMLNCGSRILLIGIIICGIAIRLTATGFNWNGKC